MASKAFIVVASRQDSAARAFVDRHASIGACLMTPDDLSKAGWCYRLGHLESSTAIIGGCPLAVQDITGVVTRLPYVAEQDLSHIVSADRAYVAAEMNAFLMCWLTELTCPVLNRPTPQCLSGPYWHREQWVRAADRLGIPVTPVHQHVRISAPRTETASPQPDSVTVTVVGARHVGAVDPLLSKQARSLAAAAGVPLLAVRFSGPTPGSPFVDATFWPDIADGDVADAILAYLQGGSRSCGGN